MLSEIFQRQYDFENQRRGEVTSASGSPIVGITLISSALAVAVLDFPYEKSMRAVIFVLLATGALLGLGAAVCLIFRSIWNYVYQKVPPGPLLSEYLNQLRAWHLKQGVEVATAAAAAEVDFREYLDGKLSEAADWNGQNNDRRGNFLHMATTALAISLIFFLPTILLYAYAKATAPEKIHRIELIRPNPEKDSAMTNLDKSGVNVPATQPASTPSVPASIPTAAEAKPSGPPNSLYRTNTESPSPQAGDGLVKKHGG